jgi:hypothetical protein
VSNELTDEEKKLLQGVAMPGDADEAANKQQAETKVARGRRAKGDDKETLKKVDSEVKQEGTESGVTGGSDERGPMSPAQHDDDGWGDTPVQMRGPVEPPEDEKNAPIPGSPVEGFTPQEPSEDGKQDDSQK